MNRIVETPDISPLRGAGKVSLRHPTPQDGFALNQLVAASPPLDSNSIYCNLLQCLHFRDTSIAADVEGKLVGFISGYILPGKPDTVFVWQVVIAEAARGQGLAKRMLLQLVRSLALRKLQFIETTITPANQASWALFRSLASELDAALESRMYFSRDPDFGGQHDDEHLLRIGPIRVSTS